MSFIRALEKGRFSNIKEGLYVYPCDESIECCGGWKVPSEEWIEIMFRILERAGIQFTLNDINQVRKSIYLKPIKQIIPNEEACKRYFQDFKKQKQGKSEK